MDELNYHPNEIARSLTKHSTKIIGVLVPVVDNPFFAEVVSELSQAITKSGYKMMLYIAKSDEDTAPEYINMLKANQVDGIIVCLRGQPIEAELTPDLPAVSFERLGLADLPTIVCDNAQGGRLAAEELLSCGCKRPMMVSAFFDHNIPAYDRMKGFAEVMQVNHVAMHFVEETIADADMEGAGKYAKLVKRALEEYPDADGVFCTSDLMASFMIHELKQRGKRVPEDVQVIGFNSNSFASHLTPKLTSIRQPLAQMSTEAVNCLIRQMNGERLSGDIVFPVTLDRRESTKTNKAV